MPQLHRNRICLSVLLAGVLAGGCSDAGTQATPTDATPEAATEDESTGAVAADSVSYEGLDVSHYQGDVDWSSVKAAGKVFAFAKATQGTDDVDPQFSTNWSGMKSAGIVRGAYHFFEPDVDATAQAEFFISNVTLEAGDLPPVIDIEVSEGVSVEGIDEDVRTWLDKVAAAYGVNPIIYSDLSFINEYLSSGFSAYPLWIAEYTDTAPEAPGDWQQWTFWQYSDTGTVDGIDGDVDLDRYQGTEADWQALLVSASE